MGHRWKSWGRDIDSIDVQTETVHFIEHGKVWYTNDELPIKIRQKCEISIEIHRDSLLMTSNDNDTLANVQVFIVE